MNTAFFNPEAELSIIGAMLQSAVAAKRHAELSENDFAEPGARAAFQAIRALVLSGEPVDLVTVNTALSKLGTDQTELLLRANDLVPAPSAVGSYIRAVRECSQRRRLDAIGREIAEGASDSVREISGVVNEAQQALRMLDSGRTGALNSMSDLAIAGYDDIDKRAGGRLKLIPTGIPALDHDFGGIEPGEYWLIGARPSVGKSAFAMYLALSAAKAGYKVCVVSREMTAEQYAQRFFSYVTCIPGHKMRSGELSPQDFNDLTDCLPVLASLPINFIFDVRTVEQLRMNVQRMVEEKAIDLLVIDYLQLLDTERRTEKAYQRVGAISRVLQQMTRDFHLPILALSQLSRPAPGSNPLPRLSDLRESGDLEQDADNVLLLHRCEQAEEAGVLPEDRAHFESLVAGNRRYITVIQAKGRQCGTGKFAMIFQPDIMRFWPIEHAGGNA